jgi:hypothetical protein
MGNVSFVGASGEEKALLLGSEFRNLEVIGFGVEDGLIRTRVVIAGAVVTLIGDPQQALLTYLGGQGGETTQ